ncbi:uroporphyrinogen-III C-methyltransferase [Aquabacterium sp.]|uniref:uroporphyrinogen-III C-methyltransferase n=1 Tax=Aquabacterium sp. TaxID=1872578 RepID=UPI003784BF7C
MNDTASTPESGPAAGAGADAATSPAAAPASAMPAATGIGPAAAPAVVSVSQRSLLIGAVVAGAFAVASLTLAIYTQQRVKTLEQELVRRQQDSQSQAIEARAVAKQAQEVAHAAEAKVAVLEGRVAENALQRSQLEELIQQLSRSRDENVLADVEQAIRVAVQQTSITGSAEPLINAMRQGEERLARINQPRVERVRRALARDIDRVKAVSLTDIASLTIKLDEAVRMVDDLPLLSQPERRVAAAPAAAAAAASAAARPASSGRAAEWMQRAAEGWHQVSGRVWDEVRSLVRVTRIANPEAMLVSPEQAWFMRENLKLRLMNARLALMSRQFDTAQADLRDAQGALERYFDRSSRRVVTSTELVRQVASQSRQLAVPRPDETLAAIAAAQAGR